LTPHPNSRAYGAVKAAIGHFCDSLPASSAWGPASASAKSPRPACARNSNRDAIGLDRVDAELYDGVGPIEPEDIAALALTVLAAPPHLDVSRIEVYPASQADRRDEGVAARVRCAPCHGSGPRPEPANPYAKDFQN